MLGWAHSSFKNKNLVARKRTGKGEGWNGKEEGKGGSEIPKIARSKHSLVTFFAASAPSFPDSSFFTIGLCPTLY